MSAPALNRLTIEYLRGSVTPFELPFQGNTQLTIVYGQNGTGKSTIADAFDLLGNGKVGSLEPRGLGQTRPYWPSAGKSAGDVAVKLDTASGVCSVSLTKRDVSVHNEHLRPQVEVLRRSEILKLVDAKPSERYAAIQRFIDVSGVEASESTLRRLIKDKKTEFDSATTRITENHDAIERYWEQAGKPGTSSLTWAEKEAATDPNELDAQKQAFDELTRLWDQLTVHPAILQRLAGDLQTAKNDQQDAQRALDQLQASASADYLDVLDLLRAAQTHLHAHPNPDVCPLCESPDKAAGLTAEVDRRLRSQGLYDKLQAAKQAQISKSSTVQTARQRLNDARDTATADANALAAFCRGDQAPADTDLPNLPAPTDTADWPTWIADNQNRRTSWQTAAEACTARKQLIGDLKTALEPLAGNQTQAQALDALLPRLKRMLERVESERKRFTDAILDDISTRVGELYEAMHPGEGRSKIALELDAAKRASLDINAAFNGKERPPQAYFSDSHLDTLGLCIFLALAERETPEQKILVLDDVLGSVDEPHVERVIHAVYDVTQAFRHTIVTTHYQPWREKFRWGTLKPGQGCQFIELNAWTREGGIHTLRGGVVPEIKRLKTLLAEPDPDIQTITGKAGVILEAMLDFITLHYACAVPRRHGNTYVLGDLLGAVHGKLLKILAVDVLDSNHNVVTHIELKPIVDELRSIYKARNLLGAHFNPQAFSLPPADGLRFAELVEKLADALVCPDHGRPVKNAGNYWRNAGDTRRLYPPMKPSC